MELKALFFAQLGVVEEVVDALGVEGGAPPDHAMDGVALLEQLLSEVGAVLSGDAGDEGGFHEVSGER